MNALPALLLPVLLVLSLACTGCSLLETAGTLNAKGIYYYNNEDYYQAYENFQKAEEKGSSEAKYYLGLLYLEDKFCNNPHIAAKYFFDAAQKDFLPAMYRYGRYLWEYGSGNNKREGLPWIESAAYRGDPDALQFLHDLKEREYQEQQARYQREQAERQAQYYREQEEAQRNAEEAARLARKEQEKKARAARAAEKKRAASAAPTKRDDFSWHTPPIEPKYVEKL